MSKGMMEDLVFNQMLCSEGYKVDYAVGTTYSLDLTSFMSLPFSLGFIEDPDEAMKNSLSYVFTALRVCSKKLAVFCNFSSIKVPDGQRKIFYSLIEKSIFAVNPMKTGQKGKELINFHPKVWVIQESKIDGGGKRIKVIVMSRNVTMDNSLDVVCELIGDIGLKEDSSLSIARHKPLCDFLSYLKEHADKQKSGMIDKLIASIMCVKSFDLRDSPFDEYSFIPMGIKGHFDDGKQLLVRLQQSKEVVVISPFIDNYVLGGFNSAEKKTLITREMSLDGSVVDKFSKENIYIVNQHMLDNEDDNAVDLHAKIYYSRDRENKQYMYLGSTNATRNGFERNVEFLLGLQFAPYKSSYDKFRENFIHDKDCKFEQMISIPESEGDLLKDREDSRLLRSVITSIQKANVIIQDDGKYSVVLEIGGVICNDARIYPLMRPDLIAQLDGTVIFNNLELEQLSEFYAIEVRDAKQLIKINI